VANLPQALWTPVDVTAIDVNLGKDVITGVVNTCGKFAAKCQEGWRSVSPGLIGTSGGPGVARTLEYMDVPHSL
jgi:hypothetical protein